MSVTPPLMLTPPAGPPAGLPAALSHLDRTAVMGILNVTPDSFSDGGRYSDVRAAADHAARMVMAGADIIDVGGESTRPGASRIDGEGELARVLPVIRAIRDLGVPLSIDTMRAATARAAVEAGAVLVNDVSGGLADPAMPATVAALQVPYVVMHWRGHSAAMAGLTSYHDVVAEVSAQLGDRVSAAVAAGVDPAMIVVDPGLGFAKEHWHNWLLLHNLEGAVPAGFPVLIGASRKRFLGALLSDADGSPRPVEQRDAASASVAALAAAAGVWCVRVHDVTDSADAVRVVAAWRAASWEGERPSPDRQEARR